MVNRESMGLVNAHTWLRGCNVMGSDCANRIDQWQKDGFEERLATVDRELAKRRYEWVREIITKYKDDERVVIWDMYNEGGAVRREMVSEKHLRKFFEIAWEIDPIQPLTSCVWRCPEIRSRDYKPIEKIVAELSDIISCHSYESNIHIIKRLKEFGRPIINTEWLGRCLHNTVQEMFPLFYLEKIGCWNWGFVAGKY